MKLYIYRLQGCKTCMRRQQQHNELANYMNSFDVEVVGVLFGMVDGERVNPLPEHDGLCRKDNDQMKYQAPVYILEIEDAVIKLPDLGTTNTVEEYVNNVIDIANSVVEGSN